jgi:hypothetical protein
MKKCLRDYFESCLNIEQEGYDFAPVTISELVKREKEQRTTLTQFVQGLPSWFTVAYMDYDIMNIMCDCGYTNMSKYVGIYWANAGIFLRDKMEKGQ